MASELFDESVSKGIRRGEELAAMDAIVSDAQERFLALCREWMDRYRGIVPVDRAHFDVFGTGSVRVTVGEDGRVTASTRNGSVELDTAPLAFARTFFGFYENRCVPDALTAEAEALLSMAERSMTNMLEEVARDAARKTGTKD